MGKNKQTDLFQSTLPRAPSLLTDAQRLDWLRLFRSKGIGPITFRDLLNCYGSAQNAIAQIDGRERRGQVFRVSPLELAEAELALAKMCDAQLTALGEPGYPRWLQTEDSAPPLLYIKGNQELAARPAAAIVGSRNASGPGMTFAGRLALELGKAGFVVASGLARGIDRAAHEAALPTGTIAVLGGGIDHVYPPQNAALYEKIAQTGLLISERPPGFRPQGKDFPRRNRLISGLSLGVVVVEAAARSGSLTTARFAGEQGRPVFAVPGHPLDPRAHGTNQLLKDGALLVDRVDDILAVLSNQVEPSDHAASSFKVEAVQDESDRSKVDLNAPKAPPLSSSPCVQQQSLSAEQLREKVLEVLGPVPMDRDGLGRLLGVSAKDLQIALLELELDGLIENHGQQMVSLK